MLVYNYFLKAVNLKLLSFYRSRRAYSSDDDTGRRRRRRFVKDLHYLNQVTVLISSCGSATDNPVS